MLTRGAHVDMVHPRPVVGDQLEPVPGLGDQAGVDPVGQGRHQNIRLLDRAGQFLACHGRVRLAQANIKKFAHPRLDRLGQASRNDNTQACRWHEALLETFLSGALLPEWRRKERGTRTPLQFAGRIRMTAMKSGLAALVMVMGLGPLGALAQERGPVTNLPLPRFVSMKAAEGNVRRGPSLTHRIDWIFKRRDMPLEITAEHGHWRRVRDRDGAGGWVHYTLLSGVRTASVEVEMLDLLAKPEANAMVVARLEQGVIARLEECQADWCAVSAGGYEGWAPKSALWGVTEGETFE
ncbi:Uncharacterized protein rosmuc_00619 [Roseovarius mucosus DSM 17069]|uniref:Bacterial SH3 domain protein n=2 Tax=Roseovarius mucosus TaxID=215743 RepID=A0A0A0HRW2_9RHOB|nr:Uncharacterized protein rosmuc_00619 [Roseovarius mucosus DSM 17069]